MAASAEYELEKRVEKLDLFPVELEKGSLHCCTAALVTESPSGASYATTHTHTHTHVGPCSCVTSTLSASISIIPL